MGVPFFDITRQNQRMRKNLDAAISGVVSSGRFILGETVASLEKEIAAYCGVKYAVGLASGTDALHLALRACGVKEGDEVITSPFTFVATAEAIAYCGAKPVFVDIDPKTFNLDPEEIEKKITKKTRAILPVHLYGQACEMKKIAILCKKNGLKSIEDCAQAIGAEYNGQKVGSFGDAGCFSFFPTKNLGCFGDGGMVTTNNKELYEQLIALRNHGSKQTYHYDVIGHNSRLDAIQAAILHVKLSFLEDFSQKRRKNAKVYRSLLKDIDSVSLPFELPEAKHVFNQYTIRLKARDKLYGFLKERSIGSMVYYPLSLHLQKAFAWLGRRKGDFPQSESAQAEVLSLPVFPEMEEKEIEETCQAIKDFFRK
jgi:dTDP-4-amino-4,6-dideoxygalactose transaminase